LSGAVASDGGVVGAGEHFEFAHGIDGGSDCPAVELGVAVEDAVEQEIVGILASAVDVDSEGAAHRGGGSLGGGDHAREQQAEFVEIAAIEGAPLHLAVVDDVADGGGFGAEEGAAR